MKRSRDDDLPEPTPDDDNFIFLHKLISIFKTEPAAHQHDTTVHQVPNEGGTA